MFKKILSLLLSTSLIFSVVALTGCSSKNDGNVLDPKKPVTITIWHYYNGSQQQAFDNLVTEFNQTVGKDKGIIVAAFSQGDVNGLTEKVNLGAAFCLGKCTNGVSIKIDDEVITGVCEENFNEIFDKY
ncbi:MAG: hypothetical protein RR011_06360, partial [Oscillospiraceae bacterium]